MSATGHRRDTAGGVHSTLRRLHRIGHTLAKQQQCFPYRRFYYHNQFAKHYDFVTAHDKCPDCGHNLSAHDEAGRCHTAADNITATCPCPCGWRKS